MPRKKNLTRVVISPGDTVGGHSKEHQWAGSRRSSGPKAKNKRGQIPSSAMDKPGQRPPSGAHRESLSPGGALDQEPEGLGPSPASGLKELRDSGQATCTSPENQPRKFFHSREQLLLGSISQEVYSFPSPLLAQPSSELTPVCPFQAAMPHPPTSPFLNQRPYKSPVPPFQTPPSGETPDLPVLKPLMESGLVVTRKAV